VTRAQSTNGDRLVGLAFGVVSLYLVVTAAHGVAHATVPVPVADWQGLYTVVVLFGAPVLGAVALWRGSLRTGAALLLVAGLGAFAFEALFHYVVGNPDNVANVDHGSLLFVTTATLSTASDAVLAATGGRVLWRHRQGSSATVSRVSQT
jgi:hypothetical protein